MGSKSLLNRHIATIQQHPTGVSKSPKALMGSHRLPIRVWQEVPLEQRPEQPKIVRAWFRVDISAADPGLDKLGSV